MLNYSDKDKRINTGIINARDESGDYTIHSADLKRL
jgi:hypothetical protein